MEIVKRKANDTKNIFLLCLIIILVSVKIDIKFRHNQVNYFSVY